MTPPARVIPGRPSPTGCATQKSLSPNFCPASLLTPWRVATINLRNHRKALIVDGTDRLHRRHEHPPRQCPRRQTPESRAGFAFPRRGPVVAQLQEAFANDWAFYHPRSARRRTLVPRTQGRRRRSSPAPFRTARTPILKRSRWTLLAALAEAQTSVQILTPYFLPDMRARHRAQPGLAARRARGHHSARQKQPAVRALGVARDVVAGARTRLPRLAHAAALRPFQADDCGRPLGLARLGQLGRPQPAAEF